jgi:hypothetical protein
MTVIWFVIWLVANNVGHHEPLLFNPVNAGRRPWCWRWRST